MAWPQDELPAEYELLIGGSVGWVDVTDDVRLSSAASGGGTTITRGKSAEGNQADPGRMALTFDNRSGRYSPRNPNGEWYGLFGRNTPIRAAVKLASDPFSRVSASGWGSTPDGRVWAVSTVDFTVDGSQAKILHPTINATRETWLDRDWQDVEQLSLCSIPAVAVGASVVLGHTARRRSGGSLYWLRLEFDTAGKLTLKLSKRSGLSTLTELKSLSAIPGLSYTAGQRWWLRSSVCGQRLSVKTWPEGTVEPVAWMLSTTDNDPALQVPGKVGIMSWVVGGNTNINETRFDDYEAVDRRFFGEVTRWPPKWDVGGFDRWVPVEAYGILRRLNQGTSPARSPLYRAIAGSNPLLYWPTEDGSTAGQAASGISGVPPLAISPGTQFKPVEDFQDPFDTTRFGTSAIADLSQGGGLRTYNSVPPSVTIATDNWWTVGIAASGFDPAHIDSDVNLLEWYTPGGTFTKWQLRYLKAATRVQVLGYRPDVPGQPFLFIEKIGVNIDFGPRYVSGRRESANTFSIFLWETAGEFPDEQFLGVAGTFGGIAGQVIVNSTGAASDAPMLAGHVAIWGIDAPPAQLASVADEFGQIVFAPWASWQNETAINRLKRLCVEQGVPLDVLPVPSGGEITRMGWQSPAPFLELIRECAEADGGILYEQRDGLGLVYRPRRNLYNESPLTLTYGQTSPPFEPLDDDDTTRNDVTISRKDGSSVRLVQTAGPLAALDPPNGAGVYDTSATLNLAADGPLRDHCGWALHLGTVDGARYPQITVDLSSSQWAANASLTSQASAIDSGDQVSISDLPAWLPPGPARAQVQGYTERLDAFSWDLTWNGTPGEAWDVGIAATSRVSATGSRLDADLTAGGTSLILRSTQRNGAWQTNPAHFPQDLRVGGERVTVSAIGPALDDQFTRTVSGGVGTAPTGQVYSTANGTPADWSVGSGVVTVAQPDIGVLRYATVTQLWTDFDITVDMGWLIASATGAPVSGWLVLGDDLSNYYVAQMTLGTNGVVILSLLKRVAGSLVALPSGSGVIGPNAGGDFWRVRFRKEGAGLVAEARNLTSGQRVTIASTDSDPGLSTGGSFIGVATRRETGNTNTAPVFRFDNLTVTNPQKVTLTARGVNGVNRAWPVGTPVDIWQPTVFAL